MSSNRKIRSRRRKPDLLFVLALIAGIGVVASTRADGADLPSWLSQVVTVLSSQSVER